MRGLFQYASVIGLAVSAVVVAAPAQADPIYNAWAEFYAYNSYDGEFGVVGVPAAYAPNQYHSDGTLAAASLTGTATATGLNALGAPAVTTINYAVQSQASLGGGLKAQASIDGSNLFWNSANTPYVNEDYSVNAGGTPHFYSASGYASLLDAIAVSGDAALASVKFVFRVDGTLFDTSGPETNAFMSLYTAPTSSSGQQNLFSAGTKLGDPYNPFIDVDQSVVSDFFNVIDGKVDLDLRLFTFADFGDLDANALLQATGSVPDGSASSDFFNTVTIAQVLGFDALGKQVSLYSVAGSDGFALPAVSLPVAAVPEPATWAMMIGGFGLVGGAMRRRTRQTVAFA